MFLFENIFQYLNFSIFRDAVRCATTASRCAPDVISWRTWRHLVAHLTSSGGAPDGISQLTWRHLVAHLTGSRGAPDGISWCTWRYLVATWRYLAVHLTASGGAPVSQGSQPDTKHWLYIRNLLLVIFYHPAKFGWPRFKTGECIANIQTYKN